MLRNAAGALIAFAAVCLVWRMVFPLRMNGGDEWLVFADLASARDVSGIVSEIFSTHGEHFTPVHKALVYAMYRVFHVEPLPYNILSLVLLTVCLLMFFRFVKGITGDALSSGAMAAFCGATSTYYGIPFWMFTHGHLLSMIFMLASLLSVRSALEDSHRGIIIAAACSVLSALSFTTGILSAPVGAAYYWLGSRRAETASRRSMAAMAALMAPVFVFAALYALVGHGSPDEDGIVTSPSSALAIAAAMLGNVAIQQFYPMTVTWDTLLGELPWLAPSNHDMATILVCSSALALLSAGMALRFRRLDAGLRTLMLTGAALAVLSAVLHTAGKGQFYGGLSQFLKINRYGFFSIFGLFMALAPVASDARRRYGRHFIMPMLIVLAAFVAVHQRALMYDGSMLRDFRSPINRQMSDIESALTRPGSFRLKLPKGAGVDARHVRIFTRDTVIPSDGQAYVLRDSKRVEASDIAAFEGDLTSDGRMIDASSGRVRFAVRGAGRPLQHIAFSLSAAGAGQGTVEYSVAGTGYRMRNSFDLVPDGEFHEYAVICPYGAEIAVYAGGVNEVRDIRLYW